MPDGDATVDDCGVCDSNPDNNNETCADCEGVPNGPAVPGTVCEVDGVFGTYGENCECIPNDDCQFTYFLASANDFGGSDVYQFFASDSDTEANLELLISLDKEVSLAYDEDSQLLYMLDKDQAAFKILDLNSPETPLSEVTTQYSVTELTGSAFFNGVYYAISEDTKKVYSYTPLDGMGVAVSYANITGGDIAFGENGLLFLASSGPNRAFEVVIGDQNINLGFVPDGSSGLALRSDGNFFLAVDGRNRLIVGDHQSGDTGQRVQLLLEGVPFFIDQGDLASGCAPIDPSGIWTSTSQPAVSNLKLNVSPNPTEGTSFATFSSSEESMATLEVYDMSGRRMAMLFNGTMSVDAEYRAEFDGSQLPNGVYIYRYTSGNQVEMRKLIIAR
ncbi:MAG: T9SS type A sorting domain-containing protein [Flavobacteriales bacterium]|nr:T9SS type A sorting domain-containing protein [Flavobacteriales bacterium]